LTGAKLTHNRLWFFSIPGHLTLSKPKMLFMRRNTCCTFAPTLDFVAFLSLALIIAAAICFFWKMILVDDTVASTWGNESVLTADGWLLNPQQLNSYKPFVTKHML